MGFHEKNEMRQCQTKSFLGALKLVIRSQEFSKKEKKDALKLVVVIVISTSSGRSGICRTFESRLVYGTKKDVRVEQDL